MSEITQVLSKFVENLKDMMFDAHITVPDLARQLGISEGATYSYFRNRTPEVRNLILIAEYFDCSVDFLLGREPERQHSAFRPCPPWKEQLAFLLKYYGVNKYRLCRDVPVTHSVIYAWQKGDSEPKLDYVLRLADYFGCSVDFLLGRER